MRSGKCVARVGNTAKECGATQWIIVGCMGDLDAKGVGLQFEFFSIGATAHDCPNILRGSKSDRRPPGQAGQPAKKQCFGKRILLLFSRCPECGGCSLGQK